MADEVFLIRHGQSTFNALYEAKGADPFHFDARLSPLGHQQVAAPEQQHNCSLPTWSWSHHSRGPSKPVDHSCDVGRPPRTR